jgi:predicted NUDIX family phosphoesterase
VPEQTPEQILVVPTELFTSLGYFQGFSPLVNRYVGRLLDPKNMSFRPRPEMEKNPRFKQLIPYAIFRHMGHDGASFFQYTRGGGQGEKRLHAKKSLGVGGHISTIDDPADPFWSGLARELSEEVTVKTPYDTQLIGLINDDSTEVGSVHLGVVLLYTVDDPFVFPNEDDMLDCGFRQAAGIWADIENFETWSQIAVKGLDSLNLT